MGELKIAVDVVHIGSPPFGSSEARKEPKSIALAFSAASASIAAFRYASFLHTDKY